MPNPHGQHIWYELLTTDLDAAQRFYGDVLGWTLIDSGQDGYHLIENRVDGEGHRVGGAMTLTEDMKNGGARPCWLGYIGVEDVDACLGRLSAAGASVLMPAWDIPGVGRLALLADPQGVPFYIMRGASEETSYAFAFDKPRVGHCAWNELISSDPAGAWRFYGEEFNWHKDGEMDMGPMGTYEFIRHQAPGKSGQAGVIGAIMPKPEAMPLPQWNYYFRVADIDVAVARIQAAGGQLLNGPDEIPGGEFCLQGLDPQGAAFGLVGVRHS